MSKIAVHVLGHIPQKVEAGDFLASAVIESTFIPQGEQKNTRTRPDSRFVY